MPDLSLRPIVGNRRGVAAPTPGELVAAILFGTNGFALDPADIATLWQDSAKTTPVTAPSDPVGAIRTKWGAAQYDIVQGTAAARPAWDGIRALVYDAVDDALIQTAGGILAVAQNVPGLFVAARVNINSLAGQRCVIQIAANSTTTSRAVILCNTSGSVVFSAKRLDADVQTTITSAAGLVTTGAFLSLSSQINYAGTGAMEAWLNGVSVVTGTLAGTPANSENVTSNRVALGTGGASANRMNGSIGRIVAVPFVPTAQQRADIEAWLAEV